VFVPVTRGTKSFLGTGSPKKSSGELDALWR